MKMCVWMGYCELMTKRSHAEIWSFYKIIFIFLCISLSLSHSRLHEKYRKQYFIFWSHQNVFGCNYSFYCLEYLLFEMVEWISRVYARRNYSLFNCYYTIILSFSSINIDSSVNKTIEILFLNEFIVICNAF